MATDIEKAPEALQELVAKADTGARKPLGATAKLIFGVALAWALFQFWYASPLPFLFRFGVLNDTEARAIHLAFAVFLAFCSFPAFKRSSRRAVPHRVRVQISAPCRTASAAVSTTKRASSTQQSE